MPSNPTETSHRYKSNAAVDTLLLKQGRSIKHPYTGQLVRVCSPWVLRHLNELVMAMNMYPPLDSTTHTGTHETQFCLSQYPYLHAGKELTHTCTRMGKYTSEALHFYRTCVVWSGIRGSPLCLPQGLKDSSLLYSINGTEMGQAADHPTNLQ